MNQSANIAAADLAHSLPLDRIDVSDPRLYRDDTWYPYFERLRREDPVHWTEQSIYGSFWSVTKYRDIVAVDANHEVFSSDATIGGTGLRDIPSGYVLPSFISMDPPKHEEQRRTVAPIMAPSNLKKLSVTVRERAARILDGLPRGEVFDWVDRVSIELTIQMLATLFEFPFEERRKLTYWSQVAICNVDAPDAVVRSENERFAELKRMGEYFKVLWQERAKAPPKVDLISMMAHGEQTRDMLEREFREFVGNLTLLIVGGNDTTRNSISGGLLALNQYPEQYRTLRDNPGVIPALVQEILRWQTPVIHMRRTALADYELGGKIIRKGQKVAMWYISGNRDEEEIKRPDEFIINRPRGRHHLSFGFGIHRCVGSRLAEMQLTILWEEILKRFPLIEVVGPPTRSYSNVLRGIVSLPVRIPG